MKTANRGKHPRCIFDVETSQLGNGLDVVCEGKERGIIDDSRFLA